MPQQAEASTLLVLTTLPDGETARTMLRMLLERHLVACGTVLEGVTSVYRWEGTIEEAREVQVLLKTSSGRWEALRDAVEELHPYDVPELLALPVTTGLPAYLAWVGGETQLEGKSG